MFNFFYQMRTILIEALHKMRYFDNVRNMLKCLFIKTNKSAE